MNSLLRAAWKLAAKAGMAKLEKLAQWLGLEKSRFSPLGRNPFPPKIGIHNVRRVAFSVNWPARRSLLFRKLDCLRRVLVPLIPETRPCELPPGVGQA